MFDDLYEFMFTNEDTWFVYARGCAMAISDASLMDC